MHRACQISPECATTVLGWSNAVTIKRKYPIYHMAFTSEQLRERLKDQQWTAHNIRLNSEITTIPGGPDLIEADLRLKALFRVFSLVFNGELAGLRIADLGCLEGGYSLALAQRGAQVVGLEARAKNLEKAQLLKDHFELPNLAFVLADVKNFSRDLFGLFDAVLALGILYHLDSPAAWLRQVSAATRKVLIVDSHFAPSDSASLALIDPRISSLSLLEKMSHDGTAYEGRWYFEYGDSIDPEPQLWASYSNRSSFWLTKESLLLAMHHAGFDLVFEQHDYSAASYRHFSVTFPRVILIGIKIPRGDG
jgi:2-polyprenyl-3-methyl-5-hydroxy-6-metoxy-1,4-benzoquinol methylase